MAEAQTYRSTVRNERLTLTDHERAAVDALAERDRAAAAPDVDALQALDELRRSVAEQTKEALTAALPDLDERRRRVAAPPDLLERLKGTAPVRTGHTVPAWDLSSVLESSPVIGGGAIAGLTGSIGDLLGGDGPVVVFPTPVVGEGELWWAETESWWNVPNDSLHVDIDHDHPYRIWGHIGYDGDPLRFWDIGVSMVFAVTPDRLPRTDRTRFEVRPEPRLGGWLSGWTGQYHPIWHADDKWAKVWRRLSVDLTTSTGQWLAGDVLHEPVIHLENAQPVGQANASQFMGWSPILWFTANMAALRQQQTSILLRFSVRYDIQMEGESDIWFRNREGSAAESVPAFDNAATIRMIRAGVITPV